jgi:adhesin/invasin
MLGGRAGEHRARVQIGGTRAIPAYPITAIARPALAAAQDHVLRQGQRGVVGATLQPIVLRVIDRFDNPVPGATVTISPLQGSVTDSVLATDSTGAVAIRWALGGTIGSQKLLARVTGVSKPVEITATASIGRASKASFASATASGVAGKSLASPATVTITDAFGNPIAGAMVAFTAGSGGSVSAAKVKTDAKGRAATKWTFGAKVGAQTLTASVASTSAHTTLEADVTKPATTTPSKASAAKPALAKPSVKPPPRKPR